MRLFIVPELVAALASVAVVFGCQGADPVSSPRDAGFKPGIMPVLQGTGGSDAAGGAGGSSVAPKISRDAGAPPPDTGTVVTPLPPPPTASTAAATIVPLYTNPGDPSWAAILAAKQAHPTVRVVAIVNPNNGPGSSQSQSYTSGIGKLIAGGIDVIGYVATGYGSRAQTTVEADIDRWKSFYPQLGGIFFDEQSNQAKNVPFYQALSQYAKGKGLAYTVGNPGTDTSESYIGVFDTMLIYESKGVSSMSALTGWHTKYAPANFGVIPYGTALDLTYVKQARMYVRYVYLNNDDLPNPWDSLPSYFADLLAALE